MTSLELSESPLTMQDLAAVFANVSRACPVLELLTLIVMVSATLGACEKTIRCSRTYHHVSRHSV